ncbi:hypothetical protein BWI17_06085 [Betaproteobacteria bacterium GR16-43]|nr:hypothetical protein BWI17_06085 [Betaproteobacteria bacterium GR16-43]
MRLPATIAAAFLAASSGAALAASGVYKCIGSDGRISYQEMPCPESRDSQPMALPTEFPAIDTAARDRLLEREAALDRRLEAQRDRLTAEAIAKISRPEPVFVASEPAVAVAWPAWGIAPRWNPRPMPRASMRSTGPAPYR